MDVTRYPKEVTVLDLTLDIAKTMQGDGTCQSTIGPDGRTYWIPARSIPFLPGGLTALRHRLRLAWLVFIGKADVLYWR